MKNTNCDGENCKVENGEVRVLPTGGSSNAILCRSCYANEMYFRRDINKDLSVGTKWDLPLWENLKVYSNE